MKKNRKNRPLRKFLLIACCALILVSVTIGATLAYLTDNDAVTNTFTVGNVYISLDELDVDDSTEGKDDRDTANRYHLIPGESYTKDPTVHVKANSEACWLFVKVENGIAGIEASTNAIAGQIVANGWTSLAGVENVYYKKHEAKRAEVTDYIVFGSFTIDGETVTNEILADYADAEVNVTAYAIQAEGFDTAADAWAAGKFQ